MKTILTGLVLATASAIGFASKAEASPTGIVPVSVAARGSVHIGFGTGWGHGHGHGHSHGYSGGYYRTEYQWVQQTVVVGYDRFGNPMYGTTWVQQPVQVWVPAYRPVHSGVTVGFGYRWR
jgi:hypothetical protein